MSRHDHQDAQDNMPSGQFSGDEIEFAPFMFDPSSQPEDISTSQIGVGNMDMEFEPFMFNQGDALGVPARPDPAAAATLAQPQVTSGAAAPAPAIQPLSGAFAASLPSEVTSEAVTSPSPSPEPAVQVPAESLAPTPFAGHEVPMPSYLMPAAASAPAEAPSPAGATPSSAGIAPLPDWLAGSAPEASTESMPAGPLPPGPIPTGPIATGPMPTGPMPTGLAHETGPMEVQATQMPMPTPVAVPAPVPALVTSASSFTGMTGRSRGNTGPLSTNLSSASWSDNSLASIEDFSSVLIALYAGKRMRQPGPAGETMLSQVAVPEAGGSATASQGPPSGHLTEAAAKSSGQAVSVQEQPVVPEWAVQSMTGAAGSTGQQIISPAAAAAAAWGVSQWEPQLPADATGAAWPGTVQPQTAMPQGEPLPGWGTNPAGAPPEATSWTAAQAPATSQPPVASEPPAPRPTAVSSPPGRPTPELDAIRQVPLDQTSGSLDSGVSDLLKTVDSAISEGGVNGEELEFEGFMFNQGVSAPLPVLPSIDDPTAMANSFPRDMGPAFDPTQYANPAEPVETFEYGDIDADAFGAPTEPGGTPQQAVAQGPLPFWLQDRPQNGAAASEGMSQLDSISSPANALSDSVAGTDPVVGELPPIAPFDFSTLAGDMEDEPFGFNTEELSGLVFGERDPMVVTANLEALADLMGAHPGVASDAKSSRPAGLDDLEIAALSVPTYPRPHVDPFEGLGQAEADIVGDLVPAEPPTSLFTPETSEPTDSAGGEQEPDTGGWMATVTGDLAPDPVSALAGNLDGGAPNSDMVIEELDVAPFDYSELDLDEETESPTSYLQSGGSPQGPPTSKLETASESKAESAAAAASDEAWSEADGDTSLFMPLLGESQREETEDVDLPTGYLREQASPEPPAGESTTPPAPALNGMANHAPELTNGHMPTDPGQPIFKARVARGPWGEQVVAPVEPQPAPEPDVTTQQVSQAQQASEAPAESAPPLRKAKATAILPSFEPDASRAPWEQLAASAAAAADADAPQVANLQAPVQEQAPKMPAPGDIMASGPLPVLHGFEDLTAWIERYPNDMGAHLALASAYTQAGEVDTALRVYRRMLRKPYVSDNILNMIQDELHDLEDQAHQYPRYYQVRGDLLVRQGHRREAIDEYNKLG